MRIHLALIFAVVFWFVEYPAAQQYCYRPICDSNSCKPQNMYEWVWQQGRAAAT
jgi:hypothetical protein